jgi:hypothetical protein
MKPAMNRIGLILFLWMMTEISCAQGMASIEEDGAVHPMLVVPYKPFGPLDTKDPRKRGFSTKKRKETVSIAIGEKKPNRQDMPEEKKQVLESDPAITMLQTKGLETSKDRENVLRAELVGSATRLLGIKKSFDDRSFIGHILKVCGLTEANVDSNEILAEDLIEKGKANEITKDEVLPGDIVFFKCPNNCGAQTRKGVGAGVVVRVLGECVEFIAYTNQTVTTAYSGSECRKKGKRSDMEWAIIGFFSLVKAKSSPRPSF